MRARSRAFDATTKIANNPMHIFSLTNRDSIFSQRKIERRYMQIFYAKNLFEISKM